MPHQDPAAGACSPAPAGTLGRTGLALPPPRRLRQPALPQPVGHPGPLREIQLLGGSHGFGVDRAAAAQQRLPQVRRTGPDTEACVLREPLDQLARLHRTGRPARHGQRERDGVAAPQPCVEFAHARPRDVVQRHVLAQFEPARPGVLPGLLGPYGLHRGADDAREARHLRVRSYRELERDGPQRGGQRLPVPVGVHHHGAEQPFERRHARVAAVRQHGRDLVGERTG